MLEDYEGTNSNDALLGIAENNTGQIHMWGKGGDDTIILDFASITTFSHGHHVRGDTDGMTNPGADSFNFTNLQNVDSVVVGRIEDFDASRDSLLINGVSITNSQLESGSGRTGGYSWRIVEYDVDSGDSATGTQQWLLIDTGQGYVFYALEGARATDGDGAANGGDQEAHFVGSSGGPQVTAAELADLPTVGYEDPVNYVPDGKTPINGVIINDYDDVAADAFATIYGSTSGDLIAAGLNNDTVIAKGGSDVVWGGSGHDSIFGESGGDTLFGGTGNDFLNGGTGQDTLTGGSGADVFDFRPNDMIDWDDLSGTGPQKNAQLDLITDFEIGVDTIRFDGVPGVSSLSDLTISKITVDGNEYFRIIVNATNERIMVDVEDGTSWSDFATAANFEFL